MQLETPRKSRRFGMAARQMAAHLEDFHLDVRYELSRFGDPTRHWRFRNVLGAFWTSTANL